MCPRGFSPHDPVYRIAGCAAIVSVTGEHCLVSGICSSSSQSRSHWGNWGLELSPNTRDKRTPTPSNTPRSMPQAIADPIAALGPPENGQVRPGVTNRQVGKTLTPCCQAAACHETRDNCIPRVVLFPPPLDEAIKSRKHATPHPKITASHWRS